MPQQFALNVWAEGVVTTADEEPPTIVTDETNQEK